MINLIHGDCLEKMKDIPDKSIDLVVTSPPYDNLRDYNGTLEWSFEIFQHIAKELFRVIKEGGVIVWVVGDATIKGSETGTSFKQAIFFKEIGFNIHDTMIYAKNNVVPLTHKRYEQAFEYMFVFTKNKLKTFNPINDRPNIDCGRKLHGTQYVKDKTYPISAMGKNKTVNNLGRRHNIFYYNNQGQSKIKHPAIFPLQLASDHIISWSNENDTVLDPFMGSGTTGVACKNLNRNFIGIEKDEKYFEIATKRINEHIRNE